MIKKQERFLALTKKFNFASDDNKEQFRQRVPICAKVIEATSRLRNVEKERLVERGYNFDNVKLDTLARDQSSTSNNAE